MSESTLALPAQCDVAVVGAGWAGLTAATRLADAGLHVEVLEKSRGPGGRCATRREGAFQFDHGAQYFTARSQPFSKQVAQWADLAWIAPWHPALIVVNGASGQIASHQSTVIRWRGLPGNNSVLQHLAAALPCRTQCQVQSIDWQEGSVAYPVQLNTSQGCLRARSVVITAPPAQSAELLGSSHRLADALIRVPMAPCLALMLGLGEALPLDFDGAFINEHPLSWVAGKSSYAGHNPVNWVIHASAAWSESQLDTPLESVATAMWSLLVDLFPEFAGGPILLRKAHRWRYSQCTQPLDQGCLVDSASRCVVAGDWCAGNRVEGAWLSGVAAAEATIAMVG